MSHRVSIQSVVKTYGDFNAVDHIDIEIKQGELFTLLGPSGCGKTTLLRMIAGFNSIDGGTISFDDKVINNIPAHSRNVGMVFQNYAIFPHMTVRENVEYGLKARKIKGDEFKKRTDEALELMQIAEYADRSPSKLSGGQQQRVALARAIVIQPSILLMDEPLSNLDAKLRIQMRTSIRKIQKELGITTIYVTHDQEEALSISDRIAVMNKGKVEQMDTPEVIYTKPANAFVANFIGTSSFISASSVGGEITLFDGTRMERRLDSSHTGKVLVAARPEYVDLQSPDSYSLKGTIEINSFLGDFVYYEVRLEDGTILEANVYTKDKKRIYEIGEKVSVGLFESALSVFDHESKEEIL